MFTGLVEEMGHVKSLSVDTDSAIMVIGARTVLTDVTFGASINVQGVCLSVMSFDADSFTVGLALETRRKTALLDLGEGDPVNLERATLPTTRMGGHYVQGHVDGVGTIASVAEEGDALLIRIEAPADLLKYIVSKGYIAVDGASLTVIDVDETGFTLTLIAHSRPLVVLGQKKVGDPVNLEVDILAKYAEKLLVGRIES